MQNLSEQVKQVPVGELANFWWRLGAALIDLIIAFVGIGLINMVLLTPLFLSAPANMSMGFDFSFYYLMILVIDTGLYVGYKVALEGSGWHATLGKKLLGLEVVGAGGQAVDYTMAARRNALFVVTGLLRIVPALGPLAAMALSIYAVLPLFKKPLETAHHDRFAGCKVVHAAKPAFI